MKSICLLASHKGKHGAKSNGSLLLWTLSLKTAGPTCAVVRSGGLTGWPKKRFNFPSPVRWNIHPRAHQLNSLCAHCSSRVLPENWQRSRAGQGRHAYTQWPRILQVRRQGAACGATVKLLGLLRLLGSMGQTKSTMLTSLQVWKSKPEQRNRLIAQAANFLLWLAMIVWWIEWLVDQQIVLTCVFLWFELGMLFFPVNCRISAQALVALAYRGTMLHVPERDLKCISCKMFA